MKIPFSFTTCQVIKFTRRERIPVAKMETVVVKTQQMANESATFRGFERRASTSMFKDEAVTQIERTK